MKGGHSRITHNARMKGAGDILAAALSHIYDKATHNDTPAPTKLARIGDGTKHETVKRPGRPRLG